MATSLNDISQRKEKITVENQSISRKPLSIWSKVLRRSMYTAGESATAAKIVFSTVSDGKLKEECPYD